MWKTKRLSPLFSGKKLKAVDLKGPMPFSRAGRQIIARQRINDEQERKARDDDARNTQLPRFMNVDWPLGRKIEEKEFLFEKGDLVQVIKGPEKGKISRIFEIFPHRSAVALESVGKEVKRVLPKVEWTESQDTYVATYNAPIHHDDIRLITSIPDSEGHLRKVAVQNMVLGEYYYDTRYHKRMRRRYVAFSSGVALPWPDPPSPVTDGLFSTSVAEARRPTFFVSSLSEPPVSDVAMESLWNPRSRRHLPPLTDAEIERLTPPSMPLSKTKIAFRKEMEEKKKKAAVVELVQTAEVIAAALEKRST
ncbi:hypothetical protein V1511DRAFT_502564 [Dipodascopsis uninucleata]